MELIETIRNENFELMKLFIDEKKYPINYRDNVL